jgi:hypothetical protein
MSCLSWILIVLLLCNVNGNEFHPNISDAPIHDTRHPFHPLADTPLDWIHSSFVSDTNNSTCASFDNCTQCVASSHLCHWCSDQQCHAKGSVYGCTIGASCPSQDGNSTQDTCHSHATCTECSLASNLCHWCAFDEQCHAIGSIYGCAYGVNCYSNQRCQRSQPEQVYQAWYRGMGFLPVFLILGGASMVLCCSTVLYVVTGTLVHGLYQLLATTSTTTPNTTSNTTTNTISSKNSIMDEAVPFLHGLEQEMDDIPTIQDSTPPTISPSTSIHSHPTHTHHHQLQCFLRTCNYWYKATWILTLSLLFILFCFYPKVPTFNVCSDQLAWKSIIDGITSLKVEASFEILISVYNPNRISLTMDKVSGTFRHDGDEIGTFLVPSTRIHSRAITDVLVTCTVVPDRWEALGIIAEYYKGTLVLDVTAGGMVRIPSLGVLFPIQITDLIVPVNDAPADRHLCSCPEWKDVKTKKPVVVTWTLGVEEEIVSMN